MQLRVDKAGPFSVKNQIKRQLRAAVSLGEIEPGEALPAAADMAAVLGLNRNTVAAAYRALVDEGLLTSVKGSGTFVAEGQRVVDARALQPLVDETFTRAKAMGFTVEQLTDVFLSRLAALRNTRRERRVLVVWCNEDTVREVRDAVERELGVTTEGLLLRALDGDGGDAAVGPHFERAALVVCGINYVETVGVHARRYGVEVVGVLLTPVARILNEILRFPAGTRVGFVCVNDTAAESTCRSVTLSGGARLETIWAGADNPERLGRLLERCEVVFATHHVYDRVRRLASPGQRVVHVDVSLNRANLDLIGERLDLTG